MKRIRRGVFKSLPSLEKAIRDYLEQHNETSKPFTWTADADLILGRVAGVCKSLQRINGTGH